VILAGCSVLLFALVMLPLIQQVKGIQQHVAA